MRGALSWITSLGLVLAAGAAAGCEVEPGSRRAPASAAGSASASAASGSSAAAAAGSAAPTPPAPTPPAPTPPAPTPPAPTPPDTANAAGSGSGTAAGVAPAPQPQIKDSCNKAVSHLFDVEIAGAPAENRQQLESQRAAIVAKGAAECTLQGWSDAVIDCLAKAADMPAINACGQILQKEQDAKNAAAPAPAPAPPG